MNDSKILRALVRDLTNLFKTGGHVPEMQTVGGLVVHPTSNFVRPANTTAYADGDVITVSTVTGQLLKFSDCVRGSGKSGWLQSATLIQGANDAGTLALAATLWLFTQKVDIEVDNATWTPQSTELQRLAAVVQFASVDAIQADVTQDATGSVVNIQENKAKPFTCKNDSVDLYGVLQSRNAYAPASQEPFYITLDILQD